MPKGKIKKVSIDPDIFMEVIHDCNSSLRKLGNAEEIHCTERTLRRARKDGEITPKFLEEIAKFLDVDSRFLSGELHRQAQLCPDEMIKKMCLSSLTKKKYPYFRDRKRVLNNQSMDEILEGILALFEVSIDQFYNFEYEQRYNFQHDLLESISCIVAKYFNCDAYGNDDRLNLYGIINDLECSRDNYYMEKYIEEVIRPRLLEDLPMGKTKQDIINMDAESLLELNTEILYKK